MNNGKKRKINKSKVKEQVVNQTNSCNNKKKKETY